MPRNNKREKRKTDRSRNGRLRIFSSPLAIDSGLYERVQASRTSASASGMVMLFGVNAIRNGRKSSQCLGLVSRPSVFKRSYSGVAGYGVSRPNTGSVG